MATEPMRICNMTSDGRLLEQPSRNCAIPHFVEVTDDFSIPINGYATPALVSFTVITNSLVCIVLLKKKMRTQTSILLVAIAMSDTLTGLAPLPCYLHFYTMKAYATFTSYSWCLVYFWLIDYLPTVFHTASVWLTVALAVQRYLCVQNLLSTKQVGTIRKTALAIVAIYVGSIGFHFVRFLELRISPISLPEYLVDGGHPATGCYTEYVPVLGAETRPLFQRLLLVPHHPGPLRAVVRSGRLEHLSQPGLEERHEATTGVAQAKQTGGVQGPEGDHCNHVDVGRRRRSVRPGGAPSRVHLMTMTIENNTSLELMNPVTRSTVELFTNFIILLSYPINFFIYCSMSRHFRQTFRGLFISEAKHNQSAVTNSSRQLQQQQQHQQLLTEPKHPSPLLGSHQGQLIQLQNLSSQ